MIKMGGKYRIISLARIQDLAYRRALLSMGLLPSTVFEVKREALFQDPVELSVNGFSLGVRRKDLAILDFERIEE